MTYFAWTQANVVNFLASVMLSITQTNHEISNTIRFVWGNSDGLPSITYFRYGSNLVTNFIFIRPCEIKDRKYEMEVVYATTAQLSKDGSPDTCLTGNSTIFCHPADIEKMVPNFVIFLLNGNLPEGLHFYHITNCNRRTL